MNRIRSSAEGQAVLAGSLVAFPLLDVLSLLDTTRHAGELKIVCEGSDDHFSVEAGDLIDPTGNATGRLFELACSGDAWFTVTADPGTPPAGSRVALRTVIDHLAPRLSEWDALRRSVPLDATARMAPTTSLPEVHVRADQWKVLSRLGSGRRVGDVVDETDASPMETLRILRELADAGLVSLGGLGAAAALLPSRHTRGSGIGENRAGEPGGGVPAGDGARGGTAGGGVNGAERTRRAGSAASRSAAVAEGQPVDGERNDTVSGNGGDGTGRTGRAGRRDRGTRAPVIDIGDGSDAGGADPTDPPAPVSLMPPPVATRDWASAGSGRGA